MKKTLLLLGFSLLSLTQLNAQNRKDWASIKHKSEIVISKNALREDFPKNPLLFNLNHESIKQKLYSAGSRFDANANSAIIELPNSKGQLERFKVYESSNFEPELQAQFPDIRSYVGFGIEDKTAQTRISISPYGVSTMTFRADKATEYIEMYSEDGSVYALYSRMDKTIKAPFTCSTPDQHLADDLLDKGKTLSTMSSDLVFRTFRLAMSVTGEYSAYHGGTLPQVVAAVNTTMTRVNGVFEKDLAIRMNLIASTTNVFYLNAGTDPYGATDANYNTELQNTLTSVIGEANYDIGHLMSAIGNNGNAGCIGCVCTNNQKGSGFTTSTVPVGDNFDIDFVVHEMGHQFGANHSFTFSAENNSVNYEVGSGVTIMGYAGITSYDVAPHSIETFHAGNIAQIQTNMATKTCDVETAITHNAPVVNAGADYTIPISTPFMLTGSATDAGGGTLSYQWEQYDEVTSTTYLTTGSPASITKAAGPNFRCYLPTTSPTRYFPTLTSVFNGSATTAGTDILVEALSSVARTLNFRLTVRDNVLNGGQTNFDNMVVTVNASAGPLTVTSQNTNGISYPINSTQTVTWAVNNTNTIAGGANVDILFTTDNGATWTTLLANTPNDGSQAVTLPAGVGAPYCRFMVKANGNIFFNVNSKDFAVGYTVTNVCNSFSNNTPLAVPDGLGSNVSGGTVTKTVNVSGISSNIADVNVTLSSNHTYFWDMEISLLHPNTTARKLSNHLCNNATAGGFNLIFDDSGSAIVCTGNPVSGTVPPSESLSAFNGLSANGTWTLSAFDWWNGDTGSLNNFTVEICTQTVLASNNFVNDITDLNIYPNPNNGTFTINFQSTSNSTEIKIHDIRGRRVFEKSYENNGIFNQNISLNSVESGVYLVTIQDGNRNITKKIVIE